MDSGHYYVSVVDGKRVGLLAGPYAQNDEALANVGAARRIAEELDPFACFYAFGTCRLPYGERRGILNDRLAEGEEEAT